MGIGTSKGPKQHWQKKNGLTQRRFFEKVPQDGLTQKPGDLGCINIVLITPNPPMLEH